MKIYSITHTHKKKKKKNVYTLFLLNKNLYTHNDNEITPMCIGPSSGVHGFNNNKIKDTTIDVKLWLVHNKNDVNGKLIWK